MPKADGWKQITQETIETAIQTQYIQVHEFDPRDRTTADWPQRQERQQNEQLSRREDQPQERIDYVGGKENCQSIRLDRQATGQSQRTRW